MKKLNLGSFDHPLFFVLALSLVLMPLFALWGVLFRKLGLTGPASLVPAPGAPLQ